jgi:hypothetical protein
VWESGDLHAFKSVAEAESALEADDVRSGIYKGFDAAGRLLNLGTSVQQERFLWLFSIARERVTVSLAEDVPAHRNELADILVRFLTATGVDPGDLARMSHEKMVSEAGRISAAIR